jgi:hypothetical protein
MKPLVTPTINLNGNLVSDLVEKLRAVLDALRGAQETMAAASDVVHGRNFQTVQDRAVHYAAMDAWHERRAQIDQMHQEIKKLALAIQEQDRK